MKRALLGRAVKCKCFPSPDRSSVLPSVRYIEFTLPAFLGSASTAASRGFY